MLVNPLSAEHFLKITKNLMKKSEFANFLVEVQTPPMALFWRLFLQNLMVNRTRISIWCTDEEKVVKIVISVEMVKSS